MITVSIAINGHSIYTRTAVNIGLNAETGNHRYRVDSGEIIEHKRDAGAVALAHLLLSTIKEPD